VQVAGTETKVAVQRGRESRRWARRSGIRPLTTEPAWLGARFPHRSVYDSGWYGPASHFSDTAFGADFIAVRTELVRYDSNVCYKRHLSIGDCVG
jgi:hypothetical protein